MALLQLLRPDRIRRIRVLIDQKLNPDRYPGLFSLATFGYVTALLAATSAAGNTVRLLAGTWAPPWLGVTLTSVAIYLAHEVVSRIRNRLRAADAGPSDTPDDLDTMSPRELAVLEDDLLCENELAGQGPVTLPRIMLYFLMFVSIGVWSYLYDVALPADKLGPLNIPLYLIMLALAIGTVRYGWRVVGWPVRHAVRAVLSRWVFVIYLFAVLYGVA
jgi:hypothetical protein